MKRTFAWRDGKCVEITPPHVQELHYVQPDIAEFRSTDGKIISGRADWREHLKQTGAIEMGHSDIRESQERWRRRQAAAAEKASRRTEGVRPAPDPPPIDNERAHYERTQLNKEVRNHLDGRPTPDLKTLLKITIEAARALDRRR